jgi:16S rRNA (uracil1498-N3)-methyltransferase
LDDPMTFGEAVVVADGIRVIPWEEASACPNLPQALEQSPVAKLNPAKVSLLVGPEGGITEDEMQAAVDCGWQPVTLGPRILRAETAAVSSISITMAALGDMG